MFQKILHFIRQYDTIVLHRHSKPDGDAMGSQLGMKQLLLENFPNKKIYDIVLINIVADVIIGIKDIVPHFLKEDGIYITSGIIEERLEDVKEAYKNAELELIKEEHQGGWASLVYKK